jgi:hypothetical protein
MSDIPESWRPYARLQTSTTRRKRVDDQSWGMEAGLDHFLNLQKLNLPPSEQNLSVERAIANGRARERYRNRLRSRFLIEEETVDPVPILDQRERLYRLFLGLDRIDQKILSATAIGCDSEEISISVVMKPAAVRKRIDRLRSRLAEDEAGKDHDVPQGLSNREVALGYVIVKTARTEQTLRASTLIGRVST